MCCCGIGDLGKQVHWSSKLRIIQGFGSKLGKSSGGFSEGGFSNNRFVLKSDVAIASEVSNLSKNSLAITDFHAEKTQHVQLFENPLPGNPPIRDSQLENARKTIAQHIPESVANLFYEQFAVCHRDF